MRLSLSAVNNRCAECNVELEPLKVGNAEAVEKYYQNALKPNGWTA